MSLPDRTLCWVQGPPWDRTCEPVDEQPSVVLRVPVSAALKEAEALMERTQYAAVGRIVEALREALGEEEG